MTIWLSLVKRTVAWALLFSKTQFALFLNLKTTWLTNDLEGSEIGTPFVEDLRSARTLLCEFINCSSNNFEMRKKLWMTLIASTLWLPVQHQRSRIFINFTILKDLKQHGFLKHCFTWKKEERFKKKHEQSKVAFDWHPLYSFESSWIYIPTVLENPHKTRR